MGSVYAFRSAECTSFFIRSLNAIIAQFVRYSIALYKENLYNIHMCILSQQNGVKRACLLLGLCFFSQLIISQETNTSVVPVPDALRRPERGEAPRYPEDLVIGELGQGRAPQGAYLFAQELLSALARGRNDAPVLERSSSRIAENVFEEIRSINTRSYRIGGGRDELDGSVSFIVRFIGREDSITGELFVRFGETTPGRQEGGRWLLDDLILEEKRALSGINDNYRYDFSPYERFF